MAKVLDDRLDQVLGKSEDAMETVEARARAAFPDTRLIVWEGHPQTFAFSYVGGDSDSLLGYSSADWIRDPTFWANQIVHPEDRDEAIAFCALATGKGSDHLFEYRARTIRGSIVWLQDFVRVVLGSEGIPSRLRGLMLDITAEKTRTGRQNDHPSLFVPSPGELRAADSEVKQKG